MSLDQHLGPSVIGPIVLVTAQLEPGGAERYVTTLAARLTERGEDVCVVSSGGAMQSEMEVAHVTAPTHRRDPLSLLRAAFAVWEARPALIHANSLIGAMASQPVRWLRGVPVLLTAHGWPSRDMRMVAKLAAMSCDRLIAVSKFLGRELVRAGFPEERLEVIHHGVNTTKFRPSGNREHLRSRLGLTDEPTVLYLGRLELEKGFDMLLAAWEVVAARVPGAVLLVAGDGSLRHLLANGRTGLRYLGYRADVAELLGAVDLLVLPSRYEALGMVALEALACAVPVVATNVGGVSEVIDDSVGRLVPPDEPAAMARAILELIESPHAMRLGRNGVERIRREYSLDRMVDDTRNLYVKLRHAA